MGFVVRLKHYVFMVKNTDDLKFYDSMGVILNFVGIVLVFTEFFKIYWEFF